MTRQREASEPDGPVKLIAGLLVLAMLVPYPAAARNASSPPSIQAPHSCNGYPQRALQLNAQGTATVAFTVTSQGTVADPVIERSTGNEDLDAASIACVRRWLYIPASRDGVPVASPWKAAVRWDMPPMDPDTALAFHTSMISGPHACTNPYPPAAQRRNIQGTTTVAFTITPLGTVANLVVAQSSGNSDLDAASISCVRTWIYKPAERGGQAVAVPWKAAIQWKLHDAPARGPSWFFLVVLFALLAAVFVTRLYPMVRRRDLIPLDRNPNDDWPNRDSRWK